MMMMIIIIIIEDLRQTGHSSSSLYIRLTVRMEQRGSHGKDFHGN